MVIYKITNLVTQKCYIGQTIRNPKLREYEHFSDSRVVRMKSKKLYNSIEKYGKEKFIFEIIDRAITLDHLNVLEEYYVNAFDSINNGYNIQIPGNNRTHSSDSIKKMSESQRNAHARRKELGTDTWKRRDGGCMLGKAHPKKGKPSKKYTLEMKAESSKRQKEAALWKGKTWKLIDGKRVWQEKI